MPKHISRDDPLPLGDPGGGGQDAARPSVDPPRTLRMNWTKPLDLDTVTPCAPGAAHYGAGSTGGGGGNGPTQCGPLFDQIHARPDDLLVHGQLLLDRASTFVQNFNALTADPETRITAGFSGLEEGSNVIQHASVSGAPVQQHEGVDNTPHYVYSASALTAQKFVESLLPMQRAALQHTADVMTLSGGFIAALNATGDAYAVGDQYSVFPDRSTLPNE